MKALLQRVANASVAIDGHTVGAIESGLLVLLGVERGDTEAQADWLADKTLGLRIFPDPGRPVSHNMNLNVLDAGGVLLVVSQFTLAADTSRGRRPGFSTAAPPAEAEALYEYFVEVVSKQVQVETGQFGADMQVSLVNDGPVTFMLDTHQSGGQSG